MFESQKTNTTIWHLCFCLLILDKDQTEPNKTTNMLSADVTE